MRMTTQLRHLLKQGLVVAPSCFDPLSARLAELAGFDALHLTGLGVEAAQLGAPDLGLLSMTELCAHAARITAAIAIPVLADIDTGFGGVLNVQRTIREMERAGVAGIHIEDQAQPKHCPLLAGRKVVSRAAALDRLKAALDTRTDPDFVIVARTDADTISLNEVVDRANLFLEHGADMVMPISMMVEGKSYFGLPPDEQLACSHRLISAINGPVMNMGSSPPEGYTTADLARIGFAFTMFASTAISAAANAMQAVFAEIKRTGTDAGYFKASPGLYTDPLQLMRAVHLDRYVEVERRYPASFGDPA